MARAAGLSLGDVNHRVMRYPFLYTSKYVGMAEFATVPDCVLLVRENNVGHSLNLRVESKILLQRERISWRDALKMSNRFDQSQLFRLFPIDSVSVILLRERFGETEEVVIAGDLFPNGVAALASLRISVGHFLRAGGEDGCSVGEHFAVVAGSAIKAPGIVHGLDVRTASLHRKTDIHVTDSASEFRAVNPMLEDHGCKLSFIGVVIDDYPAVFVG